MRTRQSLNSWLLIILRKYLNCLKEVLLKGYFFYNSVIVNILNRIKREAKPIPIETAPAKDVSPLASTIKGGSTTSIMVTLAKNHWDAPAETPKTDRILAKGILQDAEIADIKKDLEKLEAVGETFYVVQNQVSTLTANLATNTAITKETQEKLKSRTDTLKTMIDSGIDNSMLLETIKTKAPELEAQHLALMRAYYNPKKYPLTLPITNEDIDKTVKETATSVTQLEKTLLTTKKQIETNYTNLRGVLPGTGVLTLKPINVLTMPKAETAEPEINRPRHE